MKFQSNDLGLPYQSIPARTCPIVALSAKTSYYLTERLRASQFSSNWVPFIVRNLAGRVKHGSLCLGHIILLIWELDTVKFD